VSISPGLSYEKLRELFPHASVGFLVRNGLRPADCKPAPCTETSSTPIPARIESSQHQSGDRAAKANTGSEPACRAKSKRQRVARTRAGGKWTEARYWQAVRSCLRRGFRFWPPIQAALKAARVASKGPHGRKWLYLCASCQKLHPRKNIQVDHVEACGSLRSLDDLPGFVSRLTAETGFQCLCSECHKQKTKQDRQSS
jgi:hypothetical protein